MSNNNLFLIDQLIEKQQTSRSQRFADDVAFEFFACQQALRNFGLSDEEIELGIVGGSNDGGIDGVYVLFEEELIHEDSAIFDESYLVDKVRKSAKLSIIFVQAKRQESFTESALEKVRDSTPRLLDLSQLEENLTTLYSEELISKVNLFKNVQTKLATRFLQIEIKFIYASRGLTSTINEKVRKKATDLELNFEKLFSESKNEVVFLGADELLKLAKSTPSYTLKLPFKQNVVTGNSYIGLVSLQDYFEFVSEDNQIRRHIFDWNVRDFQGGVTVNLEMRNTINSETSPEFWWLNNGVTILASQASTVAQDYILEDVQIVNGLQTSHTIFQVLKDLDHEHRSRSQCVLVRILVTNDPEIRDQVIRATNRQTSVPEASLRATDDIQRSIESYFFAKDWFYDRRKNYHRNLGRDSQRIVSIPLLAQSVMAVGLGRPNDSRARPSTLLKEDKDYQTIFSNDIGLNVYLWLARAQKEVDAFLLTPTAAATNEERTNFRFHLIMLATWSRLGERIFSPSQLESKINAIPNIGNSKLEESLKQLRQLYKKYSANTSDSFTKIAKSREFVAFIVNELYPAKK